MRVGLQIVAQKKLSVLRGRAPYLYTKKKKKRMKDRAALEHEAGQQKARQRDLVRHENSSVNSLLRSSLVRGDAPVWRPRCVKCVYI